MTHVPAGWYRDPSGLPDAYRWWDGGQWTTALTTDPQAPPPTATEPVRRPQPTREEQPFTQRAGQPPIPPPPGAPGPGYVPPPPWAQADSRQAPTDVLEATPTTMTTRRKVVIAAIAVVCVALLGAGGYVALTSSGRTPAAAPSPPQAGEEVPPEADPLPSDEPSIGPQPEEPSPQPTAPPPDQTRLTYTPPDSPWQDNPDAGDILPFGTAQNITTESDYDGDQDWVAVIAAGYSQPGWYVDGDLAGSAKRVADWFARTNFGGFDVGRKPVSAKPVEVDGHDAYELKEQFTYSIPNLKAKSEAVTIVVVDLGLSAAGGVFLASLPDTHQDAEAATVDSARQSLRVEE